MASGGPAQPPSGGEPIKLRDWFAGQALAGYLAGQCGPGREDPNPYQTAAACWRYANAMYESRPKDDGEQP